jgi:hypothetical protein
MQQDLKRGNDMDFDSEPELEEILFQYSQIMQDSTESFTTLLSWISFMASWKRDVNLAY